MSPDFVSGKRAPRCSQNQNFIFNSGFCFRKSRSQRFPESGFCFRNSRERVKGHENTNFDIFLIIVRTHEIYKLLKLDLIFTNDLSRSKSWFRKKRMQKSVYDWDFQLIYLKVFVLFWSLLIIFIGHSFVSKITIIDLWCRL